MKKILGLATLLAVAVAPAYGVNTVTFGLQLGGDNHAAEYAAGGSPAYTPGSSADGQAFSEATDPVVDWAVTVAVTGDNFGAANLVFNVELWKDGALVAVGAGSPTTAGFFSTINDGDQDAGQASADPLQLAAFAFTFGGGSSRLFDETDQGNPALGGPHMAQKTYPSAAGFPANSTAPQGVLVGMGAGYTKLDGQATVGLLERVGVGYGTNEFPGGDQCAGMGNGPIAEGQLNMKGLPTGTYTLKVVPGNGNNVIKVADFFCDAGTTGNFAVKADAAQGDEITFSYTAVPPQCTKPTLASAVSRRTHGAAGDFDIAIPTTGAVAVEPRQNGPQKLVLTFDQAISGTPAVTLSSGTLGTVEMAGQALTVNMTGAVDGSCLSIGVSGVKSSDGQCTSDPITLKIVMLTGDVSATPGVVNTNDVNLIKLRAGTGVAVDATTAKYDIVANGTINANDVNLAKSRAALTVVPAPCTN